MTDRPIIFSAPMVRALLAGSKTQTRRLATSPLRKCGVGDRLYARERCWIWGRWRKDGLNKAGRQRWRFVASSPRTVIFDQNHPQIGRKDTPRETEMYWSRPSIHMPRWASRLTLIVKGVKVEPLQSISEADAIAEGWPGASGNVWPENWYRDLWGMLHTAEGQRWDDNPDVIALTFRVVAGNIDQVAA